jgi:GR25 family glycosyltransferase involved in LPS biosynthesis
VKLREYIDKGFYINLDYKTQRNEDTQSLLKKYNLSDFVERVSAVKAFDQTIKCAYGTDDWKKCVDSCAQSHLQTLQKARYAGYKRVLMLEDDIFFYEGYGISSIEIIQSALDEIVNFPDWNILYLGGSLLDEKIDRVGKRLIRVKGMNTSHAYILNLENNSFEKLISNYHFAHPYDILLSVHLPNKYSVYPIAITQRGGDQSDIGGHDSFGAPTFVGSYTKPLKT